MRAVTGVVQHYAWGDTDVIPALLGAPTDGRPWAELWFGTHPGGAATVDGGLPLRSVSGELPYLLKVLAAADTLSLQTHPTAEQAAAGFAREERHGPPIDDPTRIYRDPYPKPELICAISPFEALCGFRPVTATIHLLDAIGATELAGELATEGLAGVVPALYRGHLPIGPIIDACATSDEPAAGLVSHLVARYPGEASVVVTLLLNRITLAPGEAIFLGPGNLHAYLHGAGVEIMGSSDNVVRGGLTDKHVDVDELLAIVDLMPVADPVIAPTEEIPGRWRYDTPGTPFRLWRFDVEGSLEHIATGRELLLCAAGSTDALPHGSAAYLAPGEHVRLSGHATVFRVEER